MRKQSQKLIKNITILKQKLNDKKITPNQCMDMFNQQFVQNYSIVYDVSNVALEETKIVSQNALLDKYNNLITYFCTHENYIKLIQIAKKANYIKTTSAKWFINDLNSDDISLSSLASKAVKRMLKITIKLLKEYAK